jgi:hypothetical protein
MTERGTGQNYSNDRTQRTAAAIFPRKLVYHWSIILLDIVLQIGYDLFGSLTMYFARAQMPPTSILSRRGEEVDRVVAIRTMGVEEGPIYDSAKRTHHFRNGFLMQHPFSEGLVS